VSAATGDTGRAHQGWTLLLASLGVFMSALDALVVATALPVLRDDLDASLADLEWTVNGYNLAFACIILTGAALGDRFGRRRLYVIGIGVFTAASAAAALAPTTSVLLAARVVQGCGAGIMFPLTLTLITAAFPPYRRGAAIGIWSGISGSAVALGPVIGGAIIEGISWEWIFWFNVPVGLVLMPLAASKLTESHGSRTRLDIIGMLLIAAGLAAMTWGLIRAPSEGWTSAGALSMLILGATLVAAFLMWERRAADPMLPLVYFKLRGFTTANIAVFCTFASLLGALFVMTQLLQTAFRLSPLSAGLLILPWTGVPAFVAPLAGRFADRIGNRPLIAAGLSLQAIGLSWAAALIEPGMGYRPLTTALLVAGIGIALCLPTVANAVMTAVPPTDSGVASAANAAMRQLGGVLGVAVVAAVFAGQGSYASTASFIDGCVPALYVAALLSGLGIPAALLVPPRQPPRTATAHAPAHSVRDEFS
jgi:EmrB/QacA subfamily drug resistance transporter